MITIFAWMVFIPAIIWSVAFFGVGFVSIITDPFFVWATRRNLRDLVITLAALFIPGVYLFGWF